MYDQLRRSVADLQATVKGHGEALVEHRIRLENGTKAFARMDTEMTEIDKRTTPKPISVARVVSMTLGCFLAAATALWGLSTMLSDRPTSSQVKDIMVDHDQSGHRDLREDVTEIKSAISTQGGLLKDVRTQQGELKKAQDTTARKVDELLLRTPRRRQP